MKPLMINATDRNTINHDNYQFDFNKLLSSKGIKIQNDVLTEEMIRANGFRLSSTILGIIGTCFVIYNYMSPDTTVRTAAHVASHASHKLNRASTLLNYAYGTPSMFHNDENQGTCFADRDHGTCLADRGQEHEQEEYINLRSYFTDEETGILNKEGQNNLNRLYANNEEFRDEIIKFC